MFVYRFANVRLFACVCALMRLLPSSGLLFLRVCMFICVIYQSVSGYADVSVCCAGGLSVRVCGATAV